MIAIRAADRKASRIAPHGRIGSGTAPQRLSVARLSTWRWINPSSARGNWRCASRTRQNIFVSEASVYRLLKAHDLVTSPAYIVIKAAEEFRDKTTEPNQLWQTDFTYLKITGWGWYYLSTVLDDFSRFIVAWKLCATMKAQDVKATLDLALAASGLDHMNYCASSTSVFSPFRAVKATFALNAGECVRRDLFIIVAPDLQREPSPPSGRKSTHAAVRIRKASSVSTSKSLQSPTRAADWARSRPACSQHGRERRAGRAPRPPPSVLGRLNNNSFSIGRWHDLIERSP